MSKHSKIPKKVTLFLGPARRIYVKRLIERGLHGDDASEVVESIFSRGLEQCVPADWMREMVDR
jgi:hypothetical protein